MTIVVRADQHQSVERKASARPDSSAIYWRCQNVHGGRSSYVSALVTAWKSGDDTGLDRSNSCGGILRKALRSLLTRVQFRQEPARGFTDRFEPFLSVFRHGSNHERKALKCPTSVLKRLAQ
jgi:hypothetical protein